ncbi:MAG: hypothetical protein MRERV_4c073 [Mycoplasmataceae bacterium RV_VA103A]|nr:MAG: hypothetical protein MRERV_11c030 [Mycoplasmataceae bacterium RV_VA103A]KLL05168.1 MAG: hypothetical protein MRERV_4c073 [Mycoplasmataceae bacterium RV_VA103A]
MSKTLILIAILLIILYWYWQKQSTLPSKTADDDNEILFDAEDNLDKSESDHAEPSPSKVSLPGPTWVEPDVISCPGPETIPDKLGNTSEVVNPILSRKQKRQLKKKLRYD